MKDPARRDKGRPRPPGQKGADLFLLGMFFGAGLPLIDRLERRFTPNSPAAAGLDDAPLRRLRFADWRAVLGHSAKAFNADQIPAAAAGVTFFFLLALFPALSAVASLYGLVADLDNAKRQVMDLRGVMPDGAISVLTDQLTRLALTDHARLGWAFLISLLISIWSANAGLKALISGLNLAFEIKESRGLIRLNLLSLALTFGGIVLVVCLIAVAAAAPPVLSFLGLGSLMGLSLLRWPLILGLMAALLSALYKYGPVPAHRHWRVVWIGSLVAATGWAGMSVLFTWYVSAFGHYDRTYGSLGAIVGFLTWIWLSLMIVLFGAELNAAAGKASVTPP